MRAGRRHRAIRARIEFVLDEASRRAAQPRCVEPDEAIGHGGLLERLVTVGTTPARRR